MLRKKIKAIHGELPKVKSPKSLRSVCVCVRTHARTRVHDCACEGQRPVLSVVSQEQSIVFETWNKLDWLARESQDTPSLPCHSHCPHGTKTANMPAPSLQPQYSESLCWWYFQKFVLKGLCLQYQRFFLTTLNLKVVIRCLFTSSLLLGNQSTAVATLFFNLWLREASVALAEQSPMWGLMASSLLHGLLSGTQSQTWAQGRSNTRCWRHGVLPWKLGTAQDGAQLSHPIGS